MKTMFWASVPEGTVRIGNEEIAVECSPSEARALAKNLNDCVARFLREERPVDKMKRRIGPTTKEERRLVLLMRYAIMCVMDQEL